MHAHTGVAWLRMKMNCEEPSMHESSNGTNATQIGSPGVAVANAIPVTHQASHRQLQLAIDRNLSMKLRKGHESRTGAIQKTQSLTGLEIILGTGESGTRITTAIPDETPEEIAGITGTMAAGTKPGAQSLA